MARRELPNRPEEHEINALAQRLVPMCLPSSWEHRELTGQDYGTDMAVEVFSGSVSTGRLLLLQIKGTRAMPAEGEPLAFDCPAATLRYADLFIPPFLLCVCAVHAQAPTFRYLWLQEYARVVLDHERPEWRKNTSTIRVHIPAENTMPGRTAHLERASAYPRQLFSAIQLVRLAVKVQSQLETGTTIAGSPDAEFAYQRLLEARPHLVSLVGGDGTAIQRQHLERAIAAVDALRSSPPGPPEVLTQAGLALDAGPLNDARFVHSSLLSAIRHAGRVLELTAANFFDNDLRHATWLTHKDHDF